MITYRNNTTIRVRNTTKQILEELGKKNETYDDTICRLINSSSTISKSGDNTQ